MQVGPEDLALRRATGERALREYEVDAPEWATLLDCLDIDQGPARRDARLPQELPDDDLRLVRDAHGRRAPCSPARRGCTTSRRRGHVPVISAMGNLPIVKDLVVDMEPFWAKFRAVKPYSQPGYEEPQDGREHVISQERMNVIHKESLCINCGCCVSECNAMESEPGVPRARRRSRRRCASSATRATARRSSGSRTQRRARDLGVHAVLLLQRALPEGRRPARRDREARRRVDQGGHRPRHGREAREVVRHLGEDDRLAARDRARAEDAGHRRGDQADEVRARPAQARQGAAAVPAARREGRERVAATSTTSSRMQGRDGVRRHRPGRARAREARARPCTRARAIRTAPGSFPQPFVAGAAEAERHEAGRVLQGLPRVALGEGARLVDEGARAEGRARADRARGRDLLRRRRHPRGRARLLPAPERAHPRLRGGDRRRHADDRVQRLHAEPAAGELPADRTTPSCATA